VNPAPEFDFNDDKPRTDDVRYSEYLAWLDAHPHRIVFAVHDDHRGTYRIDWKPGEQRANNPEKISVEPPSPV
jgi:hypothetical protein